MNDTGMEMVKLTLSQADKILFGGCPDAELLELTNRAIMDNKRSIFITQEKYDHLLNELALRKQREKLLKDCCARNNRGIKLEKEGRISQAISVYEENIVEGCYPATHSFDRLMILYRKSKDTENEIRVIRRAMEVFPSIPKYVERLKKCTDGR